MLEHSIKLCICYKIRALFIARTAVSREQIKKYTEKAADDILLLLYSPGPEVGCQHAVPRTRTSWVHRIARLRVLVTVVGGDDPHVRDFATVVALAVPVAELVCGQHGARAIAQPVAARRLLVVAKPVLRPVNVRLAAPASRALGPKWLRLVSIGRFFQHQPLSYTIYKNTNIIIEITVYMGQGWRGAARTKYSI